MGFLLTLDYASVNLGTSQVRFRACAAVLALEPARYKQVMATMMAPVEQREVLRCDHCSLVQFRTANALCRRCHKCLEVEEPEPAPAPLALVPPPTTQDGGLQVAHA